MNLRPAYGEKVREARMRGGAPVAYSLDMDNSEPMDLRETARGIAIRAGVVTVGGVLIGGWIVGVSMKIAGKAIHLLLLTGTALVLGGIATYEVKKHLPDRG
jgi:hypothetical protein